MSDASAPPPPSSKHDASAAGWHNRRRARPLRSKSVTPKARPWLRLLNDADQADGFEYHNPLVSIFYPQEGL